MVKSIEAEQKIIVEKYLPIALQYKNNEPENICYETLERHYAERNRPIVLDIVSYLSIAGTLLFSLSVLGAWGYIVYDNIQSSINSKEAKESKLEKQAKGSKTFFME